MQQAKAHSVTPEKIACGESLLRREGEGYSLWSAGKEGWNALWNCWKAKERRISEDEIQKIIIQSEARQKYREGKILGSLLGGQSQVEQRRQGKVMDDKDFVDVNRELATHGSDLKHLRNDVDRILEKLENMAADIAGMKKSLNQSEGGWMFLMKVAAIAAAIVAVARYFGV